MTDFDLEQAQHYLQVSIRECVELFGPEWTVKEVWQTITGTFENGTQIAAHLPCDECGSSDARAIYEDEGTGSQYWICYACEGKGQVSGTEHVKVMEPSVTSVRGKPIAIPERNLTAATTRFYGVMTNEDEIVFPYQNGAKHRKRQEKDFYSTGKLDSLFGQDIFQSGGRFVTITEGEIDALSVYQMLAGKFPAVSVPNGAAGALKACKSQFEWLNTFQHIVICFDNDDPGIKASKQVAELFGAKAKICKLQNYKDANEYLVQQAAPAFVDLWWNAPQYVPDGIVNAFDLWDEINQPLQRPKLLYPFPELNSLTYGIRAGELVMFTAGSGLGKTQVLREIVYKFLRDTDDPIGLMMLEESKAKTVLSVLSLAANVPLHLPSINEDGTIVVEEKIESDLKWKLFCDLFESRRVNVFDHFGATGIDNIVNRVRYYAKALGCKLVILDHISIIVSSQEYGDERKALDEIMTRLRMLVQETGIALIAVSHLKRPDGRGHEEGAFTSLSQLRGSGSIAQLSDIVIGLERNAQSEDVRERNTTQFRVLKNRFSGLTGPAGSAIYNHDTGRMLPIEEEAL